MSNNLRALIVGGTGWVGSALQGALSGVGAELYVTSSSQSFVRDRAFLRDVEAFSPNAVIFLAGLTPDRGPLLGIDAYSRALRTIHEELQVVAMLRGVKHLTYLSSGIAGSDGPAEANGFRESYRRAKVADEAYLATLSNFTIVNIIRAYSLSGPFVRDPERYALFDFIAQSRLGRIKIESKQLVFRSYVSVTDLACAIARSIISEIGGVTYTGGEAVELAHLAAHVAEVVNPHADIIVPLFREGTDYYVGPDLSWQQWCQAVGIVPQDLRQQIEASWRWLDVNWLH